MYQAQYAFKSERSDCLSFNAGDRFTVLDEDNNDNLNSGWILAQNGFGQVGLIPKNYTKQDNDAYDEVLTSIDRAIEAIHLAATDTGGVYTQQQRSNLHKLVEHRQSVLAKFKEIRSQKCASLPANMSLQGKRVAPPAPKHSDSFNGGPKRSAPPPPQRNTSLPHNYQSRHSSALDTPNHTTTHSSTQPHEQSHTSTQPHAHNHLSNLHNIADDEYAKCAEKLENLQFHDGNDISKNAKYTDTPHASDHNPDHQPRTHKHKNKTDKSNSNKSSKDKSKKKTKNVEQSAVDGKHKNNDDDKKLTERSNTVPVWSDDDDVVPYLSDRQSQRTKSPLYVDGSDLKSPIDDDVVDGNGFTIQVNGADPTLGKVDNSHSPVENDTEKIGSPSDGRMLSLPLRPPIPPTLGNDLVESLRRTSGLSYGNSVKAVCLVLSKVAEGVPDISTVLVDVIGEVTQVWNKNSPTHTDDTSHDAQRLRQILSELTSCKDDAQQRSWALYEDEAVIRGNLDELLSILENAKTSVCRRVVASDGYGCLQHLAQYYQMETRVSIRRVMLRTFGALCSLDAVVISTLLSSILPLELMRELLDNLHDSSRSSYVALVLSMLYSQGEPPPTNHYDHITPDCLVSILDAIESSTEDSQLPDLLLQFFLAFNLHLKSSEDNPTMKALSQVGTVKIFTEKMMLLFNREDDPVSMFDHAPKPANSVLKMLIDIYSHQSTASILYTNDEKVLIDIVLRQLTDLDAHNHMRSEYLSLIDKIIRQSSTTDQYRLSDLTSRLATILHDDETPNHDRRVIANLSRDLPNLFPDWSKVLGHESTV